MSGESRRCQQPRQHLSRKTQTARPVLCLTFMHACRFFALEESPQLYAALLQHRQGSSPWGVVAAAAAGMGAISARLQVRLSRAPCAPSVPAPVAHNTTFAVGRRD